MPAYKYSKGIRADLKVAASKEDHIRSKILNLDGAESIICIKENFIDTGENVVNCREKIFNRKENFIDNAKKASDDKEKHIRIKEKLSAYGEILSDSKENAAGSKEIFIYDRAIAFDAPAQTFYNGAINHCAGKNDRKVK